MLWTLVRKELLDGLLTFRFSAAMLVLVPLWSGSLWVLCRDHQQQAAAYACSVQAQRQDQERLVHVRMARGLGMDAAVAPQRLSPFARGLDGDMAGTWKFSGAVETMPWRGVTRMGAGPLYQNPGRALFPVPDAQTIVRLIGSLLALLFTYDALTREREQGTLALCGVHAVPRDTILLGKIIGSWSLLGATCLLAGLSSLALVQVAGGLSLSGGEWLRLAALAGVGGLYLLVFCGIGLALSALCRQTGAALLAALAVWVLLVLVGPGLSRVVGEQLRRLDSPAQVEAVKSRMAQQADQRVRQETPFHYFGGMDAEARRKLTRRRDEAEARAEEELTRAFARLDRDHLPRLMGQENLVRNLARWSPAADFLHLAEGLAGTSGADAQRFRSALRAHREQLDAYWAELARERGMEGTVDSWDGAPRLRVPAFSWRLWLADGAIDLGLLVGWAVAAFAAAFWGFRSMPLAAG